MEEKAKVFLAEDDQDLIMLEKIWIEKSGHEVILMASSLAEALENIEKAKEEGVNVAVIDGDLGTGPNDGFRVTKALREAIPGIGVVSFSVNELEWGDFNPRKPKEVTNLGEIVAKALLR